MKPWMNEDIFKTWTDAQKRLWESLCAAVPFQPPPGVETWRETYLKNLSAWEMAVKKTLSQEADWVKQWVHQIAQEKGTPEMMGAWVRQMEDVLQRWIQTQNQWWDEYFTVLRRGGWTSAEVANAKPPVVATPAVTEPVAKPEPEAVVVAEPEPEVVVVAESEPEVVGESTVQAETPPVAAPSPTQPDDLKLISGIGLALEKKLRKQGLSSYRQLAALGDQDITRIEAAIKATGRIRREDWIGQAKTLHFQKYQEQL